MKIQANNATRPSASEDWQGQERQERQPGTVNGLFSFAFLRWFVWVAMTGVTVPGFRLFLCAQGCTIIPKAMVMNEITHLF